MGHVPEVDAVAEVEEPHIPVKLGFLPPVGIGDEPHLFNVVPASCLREGIEPVPARQCASLICRPPLPVHYRP